MGGVDLVDRALSDYRPEIHGKNWFLSLIVNAINLLCVFTWRIYEIANDKEVPQKDFRDEVVGIVDIFYFTHLVNVSTF